jgi:hypothetical protein
MIQRSALFGWSSVVDVTEADEGVHERPEETGQEHDRYPYPGAGAALAHIPANPDSREDVDNETPDQPQAEYRTSCLPVRAPMAEIISLPVHLEAALFEFELRHFFLELHLGFALRHLQLHIAHLHLLLHLRQGVGFTGKCSGWKKHAYQRQAQNVSLHLLSPVK